MNKKINKTLKIFKALSNRHRLRIFLLLLREELCVCELERILDMKQSRISHMMNKLSSAGLVESTRQGKWVIYSASTQAREDDIVKALQNELPVPSERLKKLRKIKREGARSEKCC